MNIKTKKDELLEKLQLTEETRTNLEANKPSILADSLLKEVSGGRMGGFAKWTMAWGYT
jgi:hypothetical protein